MKIKDQSQEDLKKLYNLKTEDSIWQHKQYHLLTKGGIILRVPKPNPLSFSVFWPEGKWIEVGDYVMVAQDNSNNKEYKISEYKQAAITDRLATPPLLKIEEAIKDGLVGKVRYIEDSPGNTSRITLWHELTVDGQDTIQGWPKTFGAVCKIMGRDRTMVDERKSKEIELAKKLHGTKWAETYAEGAWSLDEKDENGQWIKKTNQ